ncbi:MAG TPA: methyltransferase domain-containing protein [Steroidobacteraceae bacterium]
MDAKAVDSRIMTDLPVDPSYQLGTFRDNQDSLRRLKRQASIATELELGYLARAGLAERSRVLDIGCGPGIIASAIAQRADPSRLVAGDTNVQSLEEVRRQFEKDGVRNAEVRRLNVYDDRLCDAGEFDFVYSRLLFQHLSGPLLALTNIRQCLAENGRLCICDIDDNWLTVHPGVEVFRAFIDRVGAAQRARGGDRNVGGKLASHLLAAGYTDIRSEVMLLSTELITKDAFCDLVFGYKLEVVPESELDAARAELVQIKEAIDGPNGWAGAAIFFVSGRAKSNVGAHS